MFFLFCEQLTSNDLKLDYYNVTVEPYGLLSVSEGCPYRLQHDGLYSTVLAFFMYGIKFVDRELW